MAQPRIQHKRGSTGPTSGSGITAGEFAISLGTGPVGPFNVFVGISGGTTPVRVGAKVVTNFTDAGNISSDTIPTTSAVQSYVGTQVAAQVLGVCFMEGPAEGQGTIDIRQSNGGPGSGFSGFVGVTFQLSFAKQSPPSSGTGSDGNGAHWGHRMLIGGYYDNFEPKRILLGQVLSYIGACGESDVTVDEYGSATITGVVGANNGGLGFTALGLTYGNVPIWGDSGWTAQRLITSGTDGIIIDNLYSGGISFSLEPLYSSATNVGNAGSVVKIPALTIDKYGRVTARSEGILSLYDVLNGFTGYITPILDQHFSAGSTFVSGDGISTDYDNNQIILTNTGITGIQVLGVYYTGGISLTAGSGIELAITPGTPDTITINSLGVVGASGYISLQGHTQGNVYLSNPTGSNNLVFNKGGYNSGFNPATGTCGYAVFVGLSSGIELPSNIGQLSNAFISIPSGFTGFGAFGGVCFGNVSIGGTGGARGYLLVNRIEATGSNRISNPWGGASTAGRVLELNAIGGTASGFNANGPHNGRNARIVLASFPADNWNLLTNIDGTNSTLSGNYSVVTQPNLSTLMPGLSAIGDANDIQSGTVRLYKNARVEKHLVVGGNIYTIGDYYDKTGSIIDFVKTAYIVNNNFSGTTGQNGFIYPSGATFGYGIISLGASGISGSDNGILFNVKHGACGPTAGFFGYDGSSGAFSFRIASTTFGITYSTPGQLNLATSGTTPAPIFVGAINGVNLSLFTGTTSASISLQPGHRFGLSGPFGLTLGVTGDNTVVIPRENTLPTTLVTLTNTQTLTNKTIGADCIIDCGTY
jgi:hypothetical protein